MTKNPPYTDQQTILDGQKTDETVSVYVCVCAREGEREREGVSKMPCPSTISV